MNDLILFGMQGGGKGTQAAMLSEKYGYQIFETGGELRKIMKEENELGKEVKAIISRGDLVPNEIVMAIISHFLEGITPETPVLFDGIPRSMLQKETFDALLVEKGRKTQGIFISINREEAIARMMERGRADDNEEAINRRLENYEQETLPVIEQYEEEGMMDRVNGLQSIEGVFQDIETIHLES